MNKHISFLILFIFLIGSCKKEEVINLDRKDFGISENSIDFVSLAETKEIEVLHAEGQIDAQVVSENSAWCTVKVNGSKLSITVAENEFLKSRNAKIKIDNAGKSNTLLIRQKGKIFDEIPGVEDLSAKSGMGEVTLKWKQPLQDNFSHVIISYEKDQQVNTITLEPGVTEQRIVGLRNVDGLYEFKIQSVDKEGDLGKIVSISKQVDKLVAFGFSKKEIKNWLPFYFRTTDLSKKSTIDIFSNEFNANEKVAINFSSDAKILQDYNQKNGTNHLLIPASAINIPNNFTFDGVKNNQSFDLSLNYEQLEDGKSYAFPLTINTVSSGSISETNASILLIYYVDDLAGWYTVERLASSGEGVNAYPREDIDRRRYIKRTGTFTWQTGYLFGSYSRNEDQVGGTNTIQFIKLDPSTMTIEIQQGNYAVREHVNNFNSSTNELIIKYLYRDWAGWWAHERMYNRSFSR